MSVPYDRIPPQSLDMERAVIGCMLIDRTAIEKAEDILTPKDFYREANGIIFETITRLHRRKEAVDILTVQEDLQRQEVIEACGGASYLVQAMGSVAAASNVPYYAKVVQDKAVLRRLAEAAQAIHTLAHSDYENVEDVLAEVELLHTEAIARRGNENAPERLLSIIDGVFEDLEEVFEHKQLVTGIPTGITDLDYKTGGFQPGTLTVIGARPGQGKTALGVHFMLTAAVHGRSVFFASQEMSKKAIGRRMVATVSRVDGHRMRTGFIEGDDWSKIGDACSRLSTYPVTIAERRLTLTQLRAHCLREARHFGLDMVVVDYLQLMNSDRRRGDNRTAEVSDLAEGLADLSKELNVSIIALAQSSRAVDSRPGHMPQLSDLRDSGQIEAAADLVLFPFNPLYYESDDKRLDCEPMKIIVAKQRDGMVGSANVLWFPKFTQFANPAKEYEDASPAQHATTRPEVIAAATTPRLPYQDDSPVDPMGAWNP